MQKIQLLLFMLTPFANFLLIDYVVSNTDTVMFCTILLTIIVLCLCFVTSENFDIIRDECYGSASRLVSPLIMAYAKPTQLLICSRGLELKGSICLDYLLDACYTTQWQDTYLLKFRLQLDTKPKRAPEYCMLISVLIVERISDLNVSTFWGRNHHSVRPVFYGR